MYNVSSYPVSNGVMDYVYWPGIWLTWWGLWQQRWTDCWEHLCPPPAPPSSAWPSLTWVVTGDSLLASPAPTPQGRHHHLNTSHSDYLTQLKLPARFKVSCHSSWWFVRIISKINLSERSYNWWLHVDFKDKSMTVFYVENILNSIWRLKVKVSEDWPLPYSLVMLETSKIFSLKVSLHKQPGSWLLKFCPSPKLSNKTLFFTGFNLSVVAL